MRIISKFHDVYDMQHSMFDAERVWQRKSEKLLIKDTFKGGLVSSAGTNRYPIYANPFFFMGTVHFLFSYYDPSLGTFNTFSLEKMKEILKKLNVDSVRVLELSLVTETVDKSLDMWATKLLETKSLAESVLAELRVPMAFVEKYSSEVPDEESTQKVDCYTIVTNPQLLNAYPWQEVDSNLYRLHQSIEQYIWGVLGTGEPDLVTTSDKDRLEAHGFSAVTSFRNMAR